MSKKEEFIKSEEMISDEPQVEAVRSDEAAAEEVTAEAIGTGSKMELSIMEGNQSSGSSVRPVAFAPLSQNNYAMESSSMDLLYDVDLDLSVELGRTSIPVRDILQLGPGSIVELDKLAGEPVDIMVNGKLIARGEVVVVDENFGIRVTEIASKNERLSGIA